MKNIFKLFTFQSAICIWIVILGILGFKGGYNYLVAIILNTLFFIILVCLFTEKVIFKILLITIAVGCSLFVGVLFERYLLDKKLYSFDTNGDTMFDESEKTKDQQIYFERFVNDTNVLFRYLIAFPYALIVSAIGIPIFKLIRYLLSSFNQ